MANANEVLKGTSQEDKLNVPSFNASLSDEWCECPSVKPRSHSTCIGGRTSSLNNYIMVFIRLLNVYGQFLFMLHSILLQHILLYAFLKDIHQMKLEIVEADATKDSRKSDEAKTVRKHSSSPTIKKTPEVIIKIAF